MRRWVWAGFLCLAGCATPQELLQQHRYRDACQALDTQPGRDAVARRMLADGAITMQSRAWSKDEVEALGGAPAPGYARKEQLVLTEVTVNHPDVARVVLVEDLSRWDVDWFEPADPPPEKVALPPPPFQDKPYWRPTVGGLIEEVVTAAALGLVGVAILPAEVMASVATGGKVRPGEIFKALDQPKKTMLDDGLLDPDEHREQVKQLAVGYLEERALYEQRRAAAEKAQFEVFQKTTATPCREEATSTCAFTRAHPVSAPVRQTWRVEFKGGCKGQTERTVEVLSPSAAPSAQDARPSAPAPTGADAVATVGDRTVSMQHHWQANATHAPAFVADRSRGAPQSPAPVSKRRAMRDHIRGDVMQCEVWVPRSSSWDVFGGAPDLRARFSAGGVTAAGRTFDGPDDAYTMRFTVGQVHLAKGDRVKISLIDLDAIEHDWVGAARVTYDGQLPIRFGHRHFGGRCHILDEDRDRLGGIDHALGEALPKVEASSNALDWSSSSLGFDVARAQTVRALLEDRAARTGWQGVGRQGQRYVAAQDRFTGLVAAAHAERLMQDPPPLPLPGGYALLSAEARVRNGVAVELTVTATSQNVVLKEASVKRWLKTLAVVDATGESHPVTLRGVRLVEERQGEGPHQLNPEEVAVVTVDVGQWWAPAPPLPLFLRTRRPRPDGWRPIEVESADRKADRPRR